MPGLRPGLGSGAAPGSRVLQPRERLRCSSFSWECPTAKPKAASFRAVHWASFAALAAEQEPAGPFEYVEWEYRWESSRAIDRNLRIWAGGAERYEMRHFEADGKPAGKDEIYLSRERALSCTSAGQGRVPSCEEVDLASNSPAGRDPWVELWFEAPVLPTDPAELRTTLAEQIRREYEAGIDSGTPTTGPADGVSGFGPTGPFEELKPAIQQTIYNEELFAKLVGLDLESLCPAQAARRIVRTYGSTGWCSCGRRSR